jgi:nitrous oxidase accessory protein
VAALFSGPAFAERLTVEPGGDVQAALDRASAGDVVLLAPGVHRGPVRLGSAVVLEGLSGAVLEGTGQGSVVTVSAPGAVVRGLAVRGSGRDLDTMDAGVFVEQSATEAVVEGNHLEGNLHGIYLHGAERSLARGNVIVGIEEGRVADTGNGVSVWNAPGARVEDNDIRFGRDGIFTAASKNNVFRGNRFRDLRFAIHYMYTNDGEILGNVSIGNTVGFAVMYSHRLKVRDNLSDGDLNHGFLFNFANYSEIVGNTVRGRPLPASRWANPGMRGKEASEHGLPMAEESTAAHAGGVRNGPEKCVFIYNANKNRFHGNWFEGCEIGVHFTAGSEGNEISGNAFVRNRNQVKYVGTRYLDWSKDGRGNFWSDNPAFDLDGDGIGDTAYRPNDIIDKVLWTAPQAKVLVNSPAVQIIRWAQAQFPALLPGGVIDSRPLMAPVTPPPADREGTKP